MSTTTGKPTHLLHTCSGSLEFQLRDVEDEHLDYQLISATPVDTTIADAKDSVDRLLKWGQGRWLKQTTGTRLTDDDGFTAHALIKNNFCDPEVCYTREGWVAYSALGPEPGGHLPSSRPVVVVSSHTAVTDEHAAALFKYSAASNDGDDPTAPTDGTFKWLDASVVPLHDKALRPKVGVSLLDDIDCLIYEETGQISDSPGSISGFHICGGMDRIDHQNLVLSDVRFHWLEAVDDST